MAERRYHDDEVREIFLRATETPPESEASPALAPVHAPGAGLTVSQLEEVAAEVGIQPARVAEAAAALDLDRATLPASRTQLGVTISASHVVRLPRMLDPGEWDRFVVRLRDTFQAPGEVRSEGSLQTWSNGHLKVLLEPLDQGARLRFQSLHGDSKQYLDGGLAMGVSGLILAAVLGGLSLLTGKSLPGALFGVTASLPAFGAGMWAVGRAKAARWLPRRRSDFEKLGAEALRAVEADPRRLEPGST